MSPAKTTTYQVQIKCPKTGLIHTEVIVITGVPDKTKLRESVRALGFVGWQFRIMTTY